MDLLTRKALVSILNSLKPKTLLVVGDLMLDQYIWGNVERISPEGPIPVLNVKKEEFRLGGAANVAINIKNLNCAVYPVGLIGTDHPGSRILSIFRENGVSTEGIIAEKQFQTIVKQRAITQQQQLLRIDYESKPSYDASVVQKLLDHIHSLFPQIDAVVLSDYDKGVLQKDCIQSIIRLAQQKGIPVICDPGKGVDFSWYKGVTAIKPNRHEAQQATGIVLNGKDSVLRAAEKLKKTCASDFIAISLDKEGILYYAQQDDFQFIKSEVPEVFDVTGAGDTLISTIAVLLANNVSPLQATFIANVAAGLETSHLGVIPIPWSEIYTAISEDTLSSKITTLDKLLSELKLSPKSPLVFTNGYFDNISAGHLRFLLEISKFPGRLVVAINSDESIRRQKGKLPLLRELDRARLLVSMENVYRVVIFDEDNAAHIIRALSPDIVVKGEQFRGQSIPESAAITEIAASIEYIPHFSWDPAAD